MEVDDEKEIKFRKNVEKLKIYNNYEIFLDEKKMIEFILAIE